MAPRPLVHLLGLCNIVAGALFVAGPNTLAPLVGANSQAAMLLARSLGIVLAAIGAGAWLVPPASTRTYLWIFGVVVKGMGAALWAWAGVAAGAPTVGAGAAFDALVAISIAVGLRRSR